MKIKGASSCICLVILLFSCAVHSGENSDTTILAHNLSKIGRIVAVLNQYMKSECGVYLVSATEIQRNIVSELGELKVEVTGYSPTIWSGFEAEEEKVNKGAKRWIKSQNPAYFKINY